MSGLPPGWEWDYDGARWFYRYKPNGHVQFHFPKEGDEFPDFIDNFAPVLELAPEEKLESQQQLKRRTTLDTDPQSKMRATGGPLTDFGMNRSGFGGPLSNDDDEDGFFFQPENFMYLGPGAYTDVSPEADEDERGEPPKRSTGGDGGESTSKNKALLDATSERSGVSPLQSEANTPSVVNSVPVQEAIVVREHTATEPPAEPPLTINTQDIPVSTNTVAASPDVPLLDSVEKPRQGPSSTFQPPPWDPVGIMAEMATEHTAPARIEIHPDPVEMADNAVLAPIETRVVDFGIAELPERTSPSDSKPPTQSTHELLHQTNMTDAALYGATFGTGSRPRVSPRTHASQASSESRSEAMEGESRVENSLPRSAPQQTQNLLADSNDAAFVIRRKPSNSQTHLSKYQPYVPGVTSSITPTHASIEPDFKSRDHSNSLSREMSLMMGPRPKLDQSSMPSVLQPPQVPPKVPVQPNQPSGSQTANLASLSMPRDGSRGPRADIDVGQSLDAGPQGGLQHVPSVLKPARGQPQGRPQQASPPQPASAQESSYSRHSTLAPSPPAQPASKPLSDGVVENAVQYTAFQPGRMNPQNPQTFQATQLSTLLQHEKTPQSLAPAHGPELSLGSRPQAHRIETAPIQSSTDQEQPSSSQNRASTRPAPALPKFLQRPRAQSDVHQQQRSSSQTQAYVGSSPNGAMKGMQSSDPCSMPSQSSGRRASSGFFRGTNSDSFSSGSATDFAGQNIPMRSAASRPSSFSGPSPTMPTEGIRQMTSRSPPTVPQKIPISISTSNIQQVNSQQTPGSLSSPVSSRRHSLPPDSLASLGPQPNSQAASPGMYELSIHNQRQHHTQFDQVQWAGPGDRITKVAQSMIRPHSAHPPSTQMGKSFGMPSATKSALGPQPPYPTETDPPTVQPLSERPLRPKVTLPSQHIQGPMSPSTPIRSPGHLLHPIQEHLENENHMDRASATSITMISQEVRRSSQGSTMNLSSASSYPSSADSPRGYNAEKMMNQVTQQQPNAQSPVLQRPQSMNPVSLQSHPDYSPVAGNPFQHYSPINASGSPLQNAMRPGSTPPVMQNPAKDKDKGGWLSKFKKSNKPSVLQKPPPLLPQQQQFQAAQNPPQAAPSPQVHNLHGQADPRLLDRTTDNAASPITAASPKTTSTFDQMAFIPQHLSTHLSSQIMAQDQGHGDSPHHLNRQDPLVQKKPFLTTTSQPSPTFAVQKPNNVREQVEQCPTNVPPMVLPVGPAKEQAGDNISDAASVSTMDVSEAQAQPVLKPHLVTVERQPVAHSTQHQGSSFEVATPAQGSQLPPAVHKHDEARVPVEKDLFVAPLFSKLQSKTAVSTVAENKGPGPQDKWAKKPAVDYSGDDWGDDPWDYQ
ncbi:hypothetical protein CSPAE12_11621 [Colletotrichum incanum]|nr:hypothetical protein CSPAE12_11621 [Colletotrichum incanum]